MTKFESLPQPPGLFRAQMERLDPRTRIIAAGGFALAVVAVDALAAKLTALLFALLLSLIVGFSPRVLLRRLMALEVFLLVLIVVIPFSMPGAVAFSFVGLSATHEGMLRAADIAATAMAVALAVLALLGTMGPIAFGHALSRLRISNKLVQLFLFTVRYTEVLRGEYARLRLAMRARSFSPGSNFHTWRSLGWLIGMLLVRGLRRADRIHDAMICRGFVGRFPQVGQGSFGARDGVVGIGLILIVALLLTMELFF